MAHAKMALITCPDCNAGYPSESELRNHMAMAHRHFSSEFSSEPNNLRSGPGPLSSPVRAGELERLGDDEDESA